MAHRLKLASPTFGNSSTGQDKRPVSESPEIAQGVFLEGPASERQGPVHSAISACPVPEDPDRPGAAWQGVIRVGRLHGPQKPTHADHTFPGAWGDRPTHNIRSATL